MEDDREIRNRNVRAGDLHNEVTPEEYWRLKYQEKSEDLEEARERIVELESVMERLSPVGVPDFTVIDKSVEERYGKNLLDQYRRGLLPWRVK